MSDRTDALRYARELLDVTWRQGTAQQVAEELETIVRAARDYRAQVLPLFHPLVPKAKKLATIRTFSSNAGVSRPTAVLLEALVQFHATHLLPVALERGYYVSFAGNVTFPNAAELRVAATQVPPDRLLVETDSPFLAPQPRRGRPNEPANVLHVVDTLAGVLGEEPAALAARIDANADAAFSL